METIPSVIIFYYYKIIYYIIHNSTIYEGEGMLAMVSKSKQEFY